MSAGEFAKLAQSSRDNAARRQLALQNAASGKLLSAWCTQDPARCDTLLSQPCMQVQMCSRDDYAELPLTTTGDIDYSFDRFLCANAPAICAHDEHVTAGMEGRDIAPLRQRNIVRSELQAANLDGWVGGGDTQVDEANASWLKAAAGLLSATRRNAYASTHQLNADQVKVRDVRVNLPPAPATVGPGATPLARAFLQEMGTGAAFDPTDGRLRATLNGGALNDILGKICQGDCDPSIEACLQTRSCDDDIVDDKPVLADDNILRTRLCSVAPYVCKSVGGTDAEQIDEIVELSNLRRDPDGVTGKPQSIDDAAASAWVHSAAQVMYASKFRELSRKVAGEDNAADLMLARQYQDMPKTPAGDPVAGLSRRTWERMGIVDRAEIVDNLPPPAPMTPGSRQRLVGGDNGAFTSFRQSATDVSAEYNRHAEAMGIRMRMRVTGTQPRPIPSAPRDFSGRAGGVEPQSLSPERPRQLGPDQPEWANDQTMDASDRGEAASGDYEHDDVAVW